MKLTPDKSLERTSAPLAKPIFRVALATLLVLLVPLAAMQFTSEVDWGPGDFLAAAALLFAAGSAYVIGSRKVRTSGQRAVVGLVVVASAAIIWAELAVGLFT